MNTGRQGALLQMHPFLPASLASPQSTAAPDDRPPLPGGTTLRTNEAPSHRSTDHSGRLMCAEPQLKRGPE